MKKLFIIITIFFLSTNLYAAGGSSGGDGQENKQSNYKSAVNYVKAGKKLEKKGKIEKAKVKYEKAFKRLLKANDKDLHLFFEDSYKEVIAKEQYWLNGDIDWAFIDWAKQKAGSKDAFDKMHSDKIHFKPEVYTMFINELLGPQVQKKIKG